MSKAAIERRLADVASEAKRLRTELAVIEEQLVHFAADADDLRLRSIVAGDMARTWAIVAGLVEFRWPWRAMLASNSGKPACSRLLAGPSNAAQHWISSSTAWSS